LPAQAAAPPPPEGSEEAAEAAAEKQHLDGTLCSCLCSLAEVLMNRAQEGEGEGEAGIDGVAAEVEALLGEARTLSPASPEPLQALASLRQQQGKDEEALAVLRQSLAMWFKPTPDSEDEDEEEEEGEEEGKAAGKKVGGAAGLSCGPTVGCWAVAGASAS